MSGDNHDPRWPLAAALTLLIIGLLRVASLSQPALLDNTESRYGGIAWQMHESGDWVTPRIHVHGELKPFNAKPPLEFWLAAISYRAFGVCEWSARLPSFFLGLALVAATICFTARLWDKATAALAGIILASSVLFFVLSGACDLDVPLTVGVAGAMICFALFAQPGSLSPLGRRMAWGRGMFVALAVGMLAKGPVALVLAGLAIAAWLTLARRWRLAIALPWISGICLFFLVAAPWYLLAERATPGFLYYFFVVENFRRYVFNEYGDQFGYGRLQPYGAIWFFFFGAMLPWTVLAAAALGRLARHDVVKLCRKLRWTQPRLAWSGLVLLLRKFGENDPWLAYALIWGLVPPLFFTLARQVLWTYVLPGLPGVAIATAVALERWRRSETAEGLLKALEHHFVAIAAVAGTGIVVASVWFEKSPATMAAFLAALAVLAWFAWRAAERRDIAALTTAVGLLTPLAFVSAVWLFGPWLSDRNSAKAIVAVVHQDLKIRQRPVMAPIGKANYSAGFYAEAIFHGRFLYDSARGDELLPEILNRHDDPILLLKLGDWRSLKRKRA